MSLEPDHTPSTTITSLVIVTTLFLSLSQTEAQVSDLGSQAQLLQFPLPATWTLVPYCSHTSLRVQIWSDLNWDYHSDVICRLKAINSFLLFQNKENNFY